MLWKPHVLIWKNGMEAINKVSTFHFLYIYSFWRVIIYHFSTVFLLLSTLNHIAVSLVDLSLSRILAASGCCGQMFRAGSTGHACPANLYTFLPLYLWNVYENVECTCVKPNSSNSYCNTLCMFARVLTFHRPRQHFVGVGCPLTITLTSALFRWHSKVIQQFQARASSCATVLKVHRFDSWLSINI